MFIDLLKLEVVNSYVLYGKISKMNHVFGSFGLRVSSFCPYLKPHFVLPMLALNYYEERKINQALNECLYEI